jgi:hypothetical protein
MGERLNIEIKENNKVLANAYYHWSGYTSSSLELTQIVLDNIDKINYDNRIVNAIKLLEITGAGLTKEDKNYGNKFIKNFDSYSFKDAIDRNDGLLAISPKGIEETEQWEEHRVEINLDTKSIYFGSLWNCTKEEFLEDYSEDEFDDIPIYNSLDFKNLSFDDFPKAKEIILDLIKTNTFYMRLESQEDIISFIE